MPVEVALVNNRNFAQIIHGLDMPRMKTAFLKEILVKFDIFVGVPNQAAQLFALNILQFIPRTPLISHQPD